MERPKFKWCRETIEQIRFKPDRDRVWNELMAHIEDRVEDMKTRGYTEEEAEARAVTAMGDPVAVGKQLDAVHKPWLGWLWKISRWLVGLAVAAAILCLLCVGNSNLTAWTGVSEFDREVAWNTEKYGLLYERKSNAQTKWDRYTFRVTDITRYKDSPELSFRLVVSGFLPWEKCLFLNEMYAVDSLGNRYDNIAGMYFSSLPNAYQRNYLGLATAIDRGVLSWEYCGNIDTLAPEAEWFELRYEKTGQNIVLRVYLPGGEG